MVHAIHQSTNNSGIFPQVFLQCTYIIHVIMLMVHTQFWKQFYIMYICPHYVQYIVFIQAVQNLTGNPLVQIWQNITRHTSEPL